VYWVIAMPLKRDEFFVLQDACMMVVHEELNVDAVDVSKMEFTKNRFSLRTIQKLMPWQP
jgi:hypothetical protein